LHDSGVDAVDRPDRSPQHPSLFVELAIFVISPVSHVCPPATIIAMHDRRSAASSSPPRVVRAAIWVGRTLGRWRKQRLASKHDALISAWKSAWVTGCEACWRGVGRDHVPHRRGRDRAAWLAGWGWASTQPDRRRTRTHDSARPYNPGRRATDAVAG
jgi:hypothetical protein